MSEVKNTATSRDFIADRAICDAAAGGPLYVAHIFGVAYVIDANGDVFSEGENEADARFIAEARTGWPAALDEIQRYRQALESIAAFAGEDCYDSRPLRDKYEEMRNIAKEALGYDEETED